MEIQLPPGVGAGAAIDIVVPDGRQLTFSVPHGTPAGSHLNIWFNPVDGTFSTNPPAPTSQGDQGQVFQIGQYKMLLP